MAMPKQDDLENELRRKVLQDLKAQEYLQSPEMMKSYNHENADVERQSLSAGLLESLGKSSAQAGTLGGIAPQSSVQIPRLNPMQPMTRELNPNVLKYLETAQRDRLKDEYEQQQLGERNRQLDQQSNLAKEHNSLLERLSNSRNENSRVLAGMHINAKNNAPKKPKQLPDKDSTDIGNMMGVFDQYNEILDEWKRSASTFGSSASSILPWTEAAKYKDYVRPMSQTILRNLNNGRSPNPKQQMMLDNMFPGVTDRDPQVEKKTQEFFRHSFEKVQGYLKSKENAGYDMTPYWSQLQEYQAKYGDRGTQSSPAAKTGPGSGMIHHPHAGAPQGAPPPPTAPMGVPPVAPTAPPMGAPPPPPPPPPPTTGMQTFYSPDGKQKATVDPGSLDAFKAQFPEWRAK